ncbi:hypothetical protein ACJX0J_013956, partial [Zea mays]
LPQGLTNLVFIPNRKQFDVQQCFFGPSQWSGHYNPQHKAYYNVTLKRKTKSDSTDRVEVYCVYLQLAYSIWFSSRDNKTSISCTCCIEFTTIDQWM